MPDYTPTVTRENIDRFIKRDYSMYNEEDIWGILNSHGYGRSFRIYAAALKEGRGNIDKLKEMIELANFDYRDLLMSAEYPNQQKERCGYHSPETIQADEKQYYDWFNKQ